MLELYEVKSIQCAPEPSDAKAGFGPGKTGLHEPNNTKYEGTYFVCTKYLRLSTRISSYSTVHNGLDPIDSGGHDQTGRPTSRASTS
jgi:hypothetical protein